MDELFSGMGGEAEEQDSGQGGGMGAVWGALIGGIFDSVGKSQDLQNQNAAFGNAAFFKAGSYNNKNNDLIIFIVLLVVLLLVFLAFKFL